MLWNKLGHTEASREMVVQ